MKKAPNGVEKLIAKRVEELVGVKNQRDIAREAGFTNPNMISMLKTGQTKLALDRVPAMARALEVDRVRLFKLALEQFFSEESLKDILDMMSTTTTRNEQKILEVIREASGNSDPELTDDLRQKLVANFSDTRH